MYQQQAERRVAVLPMITTVILMVFTAGALGFVIVALFMPLIKLIQAVSGGSGI